MCRQGESPFELAGLAQSLREKAVEVKVPYDVLDIVGTGGDGIGSINISTGAAILAASAGAKVAKHGNRSVSSKCGSADVLEALGIEIDLGPEGVVSCIDQAGIGFMFAPRYSPHMRSIKSVRQSLKLRTVFNILGPMLNPAKAKYALIGVYTPTLMKTMGDALTNLSVKKTLIVHSLGLDELTPMGPADVLEITEKRSASYTVDPKDFGIPRCEVKDLLGGDRDVNAQKLLDVFDGSRGAAADALNLNAGFALAACGLVSTPQEGIALAQEVQRSGKAMNIIEKWRVVSRDEKAKEMSVTAA